MAKDAKGHGSEKRGVAGNIQQAYKQAATLGPDHPSVGASLQAAAKAQLNDLRTNPSGPHVAAGVDKSGRTVPVTVSDADAAKALAGGGAKSAPVDTHPSMGGKPVGQMKMSASDFAALRTAVTPHLATTADPSHSAMRQRWDAMHKSGFDTRPLYKAGLNDDHIDTALRRIQGR